MIDELLTLCAKRNSRVKKYLHDGDRPLDELVVSQADMVRNNAGKRPMRGPEDYFECLERHAARMTDAQTGREVRCVIEKSRAICTADHHGALFSSQSFQGDLLYAYLLEQLGAAAGVVPIMAAGQVELENATYARGICAYTALEEKQLFPLFPAKYSVTLASHAPVVNTEMTERFRRRFVRGEGRDGVSVEESVAGVLDTILQKGYESAQAQEKTRFGDQITSVGTGISGSLFRGNSPTFVYLENEEVIMPLLLQELEEPDSLIHRFLCDPELRRAFAETEADDDGTMLGGLLFRAVDEKGRKILLALSSEGDLIGRDWHGQEVRYSAEPGELIRLLRERKVFPGTFTLALLTFFERGITWLGGMFQSGYLPDWQQRLIRLLEDHGLAAEAQSLKQYDCSGYISGPMFALYSTAADARGQRYAAGAGPVEFMLRQPAWDRMAEMIRGVSMADAHRIGLAEMYFDLVLRDERAADWYKETALELGTRFSDGKAGI